MAEKKVRLFYLGGIQTHRQNQTVTSGGEVFKLPPKGEFLELPEHVAVDLERKHKYILHNGDTLSVFTRDARVAKRVMQGMSAEQAYAPMISAADLDDEALLEELRKRGILEEAKAETPKAPAKSKTAKAANTRGKPKALPQVPVGIDPLNPEV